MLESSSSKDWVGPGFEIMGSDKVAIFSREHNILSDRRLLLSPSNKLLSTACPHHVTFP
jgi:hypothetical protein